MFFDVFLFFACLEEFVCGRHMPKIQKFLAQFCLESKLLWIQSQKRTLQGKTKQTINLYQVILLKLRSETIFTIELSTSKAHTPDLLFENDFRFRGVQCCRSRPFLPVSLIFVRLPFDVVLVSIYVTVTIWSISLLPPPFLPIFFSLPVYAF